MPALHLTDLARSAARHDDEDPSDQARRLYDRPDADPLPEPNGTVARMPLPWRLDRLVDVLRGLRTTRAATSEETPAVAD